jgi:hypothetical protein
LLCRKRNPQVHIINLGQKFFGLHLVEEKIEETFLSRWRLYSVFTISIANNSFIKTKKLLHGTRVVHLLYRENSFLQDTRGRTKINLLYCEKGQLEAKNIF